MHGAPMDNKLETALADFHREWNAWCSHLKEARDDPQGFFTHVSESVEIMARQGGLVLGADISEELRREVHERLGQVIAVLQARIAERVKPMEVWDGLLNTVYESMSSGLAVGQSPTGRVPFRTGN